MKSEKAKLLKTKQLKQKTAGTECVAFSTMGTRMGASGPRVLAMLVWFAQRRLLQEDHKYFVVAYSLFFDTK